MARSHRILYAIYIVVWAVMAVNPKYRDDWLLENLLVFISFPLLLWLDTRRPLSFMTLFSVLIFASLHSLGSHFTYAEMEYFDVVTQFFGFERNHFDRVVHFLFGALLFGLFFEIAANSVRGYRSAMAAGLMFIVSISGVYEVVEWIVAAVLHPELRIAFMGAQGDVWDAQKDMGLALLGALINLLFYRYYERLFTDCTEKGEIR